MKIHGITVKKHWAWSKWFTKHVNEMLNTNPRRTLDDYEKSAEKYARWLAQRDGVSLDEANHTQCNWDYGNRGRGVGRTFVREVAFYRVEFHYSYYTGKTFDWDSREHIATITIPNHDYVPSVTETTAGPLALAA